MDYTPRYPQPFTFGEAVSLDVPVISEEIARLQNSLSHLKNTQEQLKEANDECPDPEFEQAIKENEDVIGSQEERISILRMALAEKGLSVSCHAALPRVDQPRPVETRESPTDTHAVQTHVPHTQQTTDSDPHNAVIDEDGGIDL